VTDIVNKVRTLEWIKNEYMGPNGANINPTYDTTIYYSGLCTVPNIHTKYTDWFLSLIHNDMRTHRYSWLYLFKPYQASPRIKWLDDKIAEHKAMFTLLDKIIYRIMILVKPKSVYNKPYKYIKR
jgi:hypothetical protein